MSRIALPVMGLWLAAGLPALASDLFWNVNPNDYFAQTGAAHAPIHTAGYQSQRLSQRQDRESVDPRTYERAPETTAPQRREAAPREFTDRQPRREAEPAREYINGPPPGEVVAAPENMPQDGRYVGGDYVGSHGDCGNGYCGGDDCGVLDCAPLCGMVHGGCDHGMHHCNDSIDHSVVARLKMGWWRIWHPHYWFRHPYADLASHGCGHGFDGCYGDTSYCGDSCEGMGGCYMNDGCVSGGCVSDGGCYSAGYGDLGLYDSHSMGATMLNGRVSENSLAASNEQRQPETRQRPVSRYEANRRYASEAPEELPAHRASRPETSDSHPMMIEARPMGLGGANETGSNRNTGESIHSLPHDVI